MTKFPLISSLGIKVEEIEYAVIGYQQPVIGHRIDARDLERVLEAGVRVTGIINQYGHTFSNALQKPDTHTALLIAISPIRKGVKRSEIEALVDRGNHSWKEADDILKRILDHGLEDK